MKLLHRSGICALALIAGAAALQVEPVVLRDLVAGDAGQKIAIGTVRAPLWSAAFADTADSFTLENVEVTFGPATYRAGRIELSGVSTPRSEIEALLAPGSTEPLGDRLARIDAKRIVIPELRVKQTFGSRLENITYRNVVATDVVKGRIGQVNASAAGAEIEDGKDRTVFSYGKLTVDALDTPALARLYTTKAETDSGPLTTIYGSFSIDDIDVVGGRQDADVKVAHLTGRDFRARTTREAWADTFALLAELGKKDTLSDDEQAHLLATTADFLGAFDIGLMEATGVEMKFRPDGRTSDAFSRIARIAYTGATGAAPADLRVEGFGVEDPDGKVGIDTISFTGFSLRPTLEGLKALKGKSPKDLDPAAIRNLVPKIGTMRIAGVNVDTVNRRTGKPDPKAERVKATLKEFEIAAEDPVNGLPSGLRIGLKNFAIALPDRSKDEGVKVLTDLGYQALDLSMALSVRWNEAGQELSVPEISIAGENMGSLSIKALFGDVSREIFNPDSAIASVALIGAKAKSLDLTIDNEGLFERYLKQTAKEQKTTPEALRRAYATAAAVVIPSMIGNSDQAKTVSKAVARFIAKPDRLTIRAEAKDPQGLGVADIVGLSEPAAALEKLNITATVE